MKGAASVVMVSVSAAFSCPRVTVSSFWSMVRVMEVPSLAAVTLRVAASQVISPWAKPRASKVSTMGRKERPSFSRGAASVKVTASPLTRTEKSPSWAAEAGRQSARRRAPAHRAVRNARFNMTDPLLKIDMGRQAARKPSFFPVSI